MRRLAAPEAEAVPTAALALELNGAGHRSRGRRALTGLPGRPCCPTNLTPHLRSAYIATTNTTATCTTSTNTTAAFPFSILVCLSYRVSSFLLRGVYAPSPPIW